jgi:nicotinamide-nucleotide amidase
MWQAAIETEALRKVLAGAGEYRVRVLRMFGIPESEIVETLRIAEREGVAIDRMEITTCLRRGEIEVVTRYEPSVEKTYDAFEAVVRKRHADTLFSDDGTTIDEQVAALLRKGHTIATAESCTGGLLAARLTDQPGASDYVLGAEIGVGITGIAGPGGGTEEKPVGLVCFSVAGPGKEEHLTRSVTLPGGRADIRDRATTVAMHLIRRALLGVDAR